MKAIKSITCKHLKKEILALLPQIQELPQICGFCHKHTEVNQSSIRLWLCLDCLKIGCSRLSENQCLMHHALQAKHPLCYNPVDQALWCYDCDMELHENLILNEEHESLADFKEQADIIRKIDMHFSSLRRLHSKSKESSVDSVSIYQPFGLSNLGNTCFSNSILQILIGTQALMANLVAFRGQLPSDSLCLQLIELAEGRGEVRNLRAIFLQLIRKNKMYRHFEQQDAHEAMVNLIAIIEEELQNTKVSFRLPFTSYCAYNSYCLQCRTSEWFIEEANGLTLEVKEASEHSEIRDILMKNHQEAAIKRPYVEIDMAEFVPNKNIQNCGLDLRTSRLYIYNSAFAVPSCDLDAMLRQYFDYQIYTSKANGYRCNRCGDTSTEGFTRYFILRSPPVFALYLKKFGGTLNSYEKHTKRILFKETIDLSPYTLVTTHPPCPPALRYTLYGLVQHAGSLSGGHYVCYVRRDPGDWYYISDKHCMPCSLNEVLAADAYILFYKRI